jgi:hypothetical protein
MEIDACVEDDWGAVRWRIFEIGGYPEMVYCKDIFYPILAKLRLYSSLKIIVLCITSDSPQNGGVKSFISVYCWIF